MNQEVPTDNCNQQHYDKKVEHKGVSVTELGLKWVIHSFVCCMQLSSCPLIQWSELSFLLPNHSNNLQVWMNIAVTGWYWDCDLITPLPLLNGLIIQFFFFSFAHYTVLRHFLCLGSIAGLLYCGGKKLWIQEAHEIYLSDLHAYVKFHW